MPTHSLDLRQRVVAAYLAGKTSIRQVAERFMVTKRTVHRWVRQYQQTQDLTPKKVGTKRVGILEQHRQEVMAIIAEHPDFYLWQYQELLRERLAINVSTVTIHNFLKKQGMTPKKKTYRSARVQEEEVQRERLAYSQEVRDIAAEDLIALDQTGVWEGMERGVARSLRGQRAYHYRQRYKGEKHTVIGAISLRGVVGCRVIKGGMKKEDFLEFLRSELCPKLDARKVVIMDNLNIHRSREVEELIRGTGARILYLPVYAPELNPIEMMWSVLKHFIRQFSRVGKYSMEQIVQTSLLLINPSCFRSWFAKCCYCTP
ncbi:IS630 family transposase [Synechococcus sp. H60.4]|uniref:IS630 family transposase n=1 Tax=Synechococcus sp. H60.4 TaxID=2964519 RepID=UPI0039C10DE3